MVDGSVQVACPHGAWTAVHPWELIRKYRCGECGEIALCACDRAFAAKLPHQATRVRNPEPPYQDLSVSLGILSDVCPTCRGEPEPPYPRADGWGSPSVFERYYWREIAREVYVAFEGDGFPPPSVWRAARRRIRDQHEIRPTYDVTQHERGRLPESVDRLMLDAEYDRGDDGVGRWLLDGQAVRAEQLALAYLRAQGWEVLVCERHLPSALFATFMGLVVLDFEDPLQEMAGFGRRDRSGEMVWGYMPRDHHQPQWFARREDAIRSHIDGLVEADDWEWLLDYWWEAWTDYRHYLWAHRDEYRDVVRMLIEHGRSTLGETLLYLAQDYWGHYTGWPDLLGYRDGELRFFEVKTPNDRPSEDQIRWFNDNATRLGYAATIVTLRRRSPRSA